MSTTLDPSIESEIRNHCWSYFSLHAQQRMNAFQFFITLETGIIGAGLYILQSNAALAQSYWGMMIGPLIVMLSFVFWKIDQRTRDLIKNAELSLREVESYFLKNSNIVQNLPFSSDPQSTNKLSALPLIPGRLTYTKSFGTVFVACAIFGVVFFFALLSSIGTR